MKTIAFAMIDGQGSSGMTCSEVEEVTGWCHQSASARLRELVLDERIVDSGRRRPGASGRSQRVYVNAEEAT
jgi:hypothetical protein